MILIESPGRVTELQVDPWHYNGRMFRTRRAKRLWHGNWSRMVLALGLVAVFGATGTWYVFWQPARSSSFQQLDEIRRVLSPLHQPLAAPAPGEWLDSHREAGQTFRQYVLGRPNQLSPQRRILYVQPIGVFDRKQQEIVQLSAQWMGLYFGCEVKVLPEIAESTIPDSAQRRHPHWRVHQLLTTHILHQVLKPRLPEDAFAMIAFTSTDLWPGHGWNYVFGQASLRSRVGVWSIYRNGDPNLGPQEFQMCLLRTLKTATHETGHMFSIRHCIKSDCNMNGSNHLAESDRKPLYLCAECLPKVLFSTRAPPLDRFEKLRAFCTRHDLNEEAAFYGRSLDILRDSQIELNSLSP